MAFSKGFTEGVAFLGMFWRAQNESCHYLCGSWLNRTLNRNPNRPGVGGREKKTSVAGLGS